MAESRRIRWQCPAGEHPGELGSRRPAADALIRYCLPCSVAAGRLVPRVAPALERERAAAADRRKAKAAGVRARAAAARQRAEDAMTARYTVEGVDLREEFKRLCRLPVFGGRTGRMAKYPPEFDIRTRTRIPNTLGTAWPGWQDGRQGYGRILLNRYEGITLADMRESLVHELVHIHVGLPEGAHHGPEFEDTMRTAMWQAYKVRPKGVRQNRYHGRYAAALKARDSEK